MNDKLLIKLLFFSTTLLFVFAVMLILSIQSVDNALNVCNYFCQNSQATMSVTSVGVFCDCRDSQKLLLVPSWLSNNEMMTNEKNAN